MSRYDYIIDEIKKNKLKTFIEIGTRAGDTAIKMINTSISCGINPKDIYYYGFDLFELLTSELKDKEISKKAEPMSLALSLLNSTKANIKLFQGFTVDTLPIVQIDIPIDLIFVDGGHSLETIANDWKNIQRFINKNTIIIFDDYLSEFSKLKWGCNSIIDNLDKNKFNVAINPKYDVCYPYNKKTNIHTVKVTINE